MEVIKGHKLRDIFLDNHHWWQFFLTYTSLIREDIITNVIKLITCRTTFLGYRNYQCSSCYGLKPVFHTCKSRFCPSCGKKATDNWINKHLELLPKTRYQHITFTFPAQLQPIFWLNRHLTNKLMPIPAKLITRTAYKMGVTPGIFVALHTFGRDLKRNMHFHLSTTLSGLSRDKTKFIPNLRFNRRNLESIKSSWRNSVITLLKNEFLQGNLKIPNQFDSNNDFLTSLEILANKKWVVHFAKPSDNHHRNVTYLGRYLKRPPIGETRIKNYDGQLVTFAYFEHHDKSEHFMTLPVFDFIKRIIAHIPDKYFRVVRYYNWLSNRTRGMLLPFVYQALGQIVKKIKDRAWRELIVKNFGSDPLLCTHCKNSSMTLKNCIYNNSIEKLKQKHQKVVSPENY